MEGPGGQPGTIVRGRVARQALLWALLCTTSGIAGAQRPPCPRVDGDATGDTVYLPCQVDRMAEVDRPSWIRYPEILRQASVEGVVRLEHVVDSVGRTRVATWRIRESTHDLFTTAVKNGTVGIRWKAAKVAGRPVAQHAALVVVFRIGHTSRQRCEPMTWTPDSLRVCAFSLQRVCYSHGGCVEKLDTSTRVIPAPVDQDHRVRSLRRPPTVVSVAGFAPVGAEATPRSAGEVISAPSIHPRRHTSPAARRVGAEGTATHGAVWLLPNSALHPAGAPGGPVPSPAPQR